MKQILCFKNLIPDESQSYQIFNVFVYAVINW